MSGNKKNVPGRVALLFLILQKKDSKSNDGGYMQNLSQIWARIQGTLLPFLREELDPITEMQERLITILELVRIESFVRELRGVVGRPKSDRQAIARGFVCKAYYNMTTTVELIERLRASRNLRRICGWEYVNKVPDESTFSRAFAEFTKMGLSELVHGELIRVYESPRLVGHISRDSTEIIAREKPFIKVVAAKKKGKCGRPRKGEERPKKLTRIERQLSMTLLEMKEDLPSKCDRSMKKNSKGYTHCWTGYKLHIDSADGEIPVSCFLTSASVQDSQVALPLMKMTSERVQSLYDLMDSAYDTKIIKEQSEQLGHVPIIDQNLARGKEEMEMAPAQRQRYKTRTTSERVNSRLKESFGGRQVRVRGPQKVMSHLMFGILVLTADQLLRLVT